MLDIIPTDVYHILLSGKPDGDLDNQRVSWPEGSREGQAEVRTHPGARVASGKRLGHLATCLAAHA